VAELAEDDERQQEEDVDAGERGRERGQFDPPAQDGVGSGAHDGPFGVT
jgi:hypothetical protein